MLSKPAGGLADATAEAFGRAGHADHPEQQRRIVGQHVGQPAGVRRLGVAEEPLGQRGGRAVGHRQGHALRTGTGNQGWQAPHGITAKPLVRRRYAA